MSPVRVEVLGVPVDCVTMRTAIEYVDRMIAEGRSGLVLAVNPEKVMQAGQNAELRRTLDSAALLVPDGIGVVWAIRALHGRIVERVPGADLMQQLCGLAAAKGYRIFLYGGKPAVNAGAAAELLKRHPGLNIVGRRDGYVPSSEQSALVDQIRKSGAQIVFVALGSPRQEQWMVANLPALGACIAQGVGGTFDVITGHVQRAPPAWQSLNLEWAYRLLKEPRRITRQIALPRFAWLVVRQKLSALLSKG